MDNSLLAVRGINHKYIVVVGGYGRFFLVGALIIGRGKPGPGMRFKQKFSSGTVSMIHRPGGLYSERFRPDGWKGVWINGKSESAVWH